MIKLQICLWLCVSVKDGLYGSMDQIYPQNDLTLTCNTSESGNIIWTKDGNELVPSDRYSIEKTALVVKKTTPDDSGKLETHVTMLPLTHD